MLYRKSGSLERKLFFFIFSHLEISTGFETSGDVREFVVSMGVKNCGQTGPFIELRPILLTCGKNADVVQIILGSTGKHRFWKNMSQHWPAQTNPHTEYPDANYNVIPANKGALWKNFYPASVALSIIVIVSLYHCSPNEIIS
jgi:hypothetical protein